MRLYEIESLPKYDTLPKKAAHKFPQPTLSKREREAVKWWGEHGHDIINSKLRGIEPMFGAATDDEIQQQMQKDYGFTMDTDEAISQFDSIMLHAPKRSKTIKVFRGERRAERRQELSEMEVGHSYVDSGYVAASLGPSTAFYSFTHGKGPLSMILVPPSVRGVYISSDADEHLEMEFLIDRGTRYTLLERRMIPNRNRGWDDLLLLVWQAGAH